MYFAICNIKADFNRFKLKSNGFEKYEADL